MSPLENVENTVVVESVDKPIEMSENVVTDKTDTFVGLQKFGVYKLSETAKMPEYATPGSACFDLFANFSHDIKVIVYTKDNVEVMRQPQIFPRKTKELGVFLDPDERMLVPLNLVFDIPPGWKILVYPRSGNALKKGLGLANGVGVVDSDYIDPSYVILVNNSVKRHIVCHGDRVAQAELCPVFQTSFVDLASPPTQKTSRSGGFGSTGN